MSSSISSQESVPESGSAPGSPIDVAKTFDGQTILIIGVTGFVGKVCLSLLLARYPNIGKIYALVRPGMGNTAEARFFDKVATSPAFDPVREQWGEGYESFLRAKIVPIPGDIGRPLCNFDDEQFAAFERDNLAAIINSAGLVSFTPSLESAIRINARGAKNVLEAARKSKAHLLHVSTCYVAGRREGDIREDDPLIGYFPRHDDLNTDDFSAEAEIEDCQRIIDQVRERAKDRAHISEFREKAVESLRSQRRDPDDPRTLKLAVARERKLWVHDRLSKLGQERAVHWGWTNTYTYTKSLGEQIIAADTEVRSTILRPAIVESSHKYPFPGWNEGFNTTAPLVYLMYKGHRQIVAGHRTKVDVIPVDMVCTGMIQGTAALMVNRHKSVYQCGTSGINPVFTSRLVELTGLAVRRLYQSKLDAGDTSLENRLRTRMEGFPVSGERFQKLSAPSIKNLANRLQDQIDHRLPRWGAPRMMALAERAKDKLGQVADFSGQVTDLVDIFKPFTHDHDIAFRCDNTSELFGQLSAEDRERLVWEPEAIDWRHYWMDTHFDGLQEWVFPILDDEFGPKARTVYTYKDLLELFDASTKLNRHRVALRLLPKKDPDSEREPESVVYTYDRVQYLATVGAAALAARGVGVGDRVMLMSENRPEWVISYFATLKLGATSVPLDSQLSLSEVANLARASRAKVFIVSVKTADRLLTDDDLPVPVQTVREGAEIREEIDAPAAVASLARELASRLDSAVELQVMRYTEVLTEIDTDTALVPVKRRGDAVASLIYTSGTTGEPKGVMLTHKNLTAMTAKIATVFKLYRHDGTLSVLPLHHTFEFAVGMLTPLIHGSSINYLEEIDADSLNDAFESANITAMIGVPALWQLLHRKIFKIVNERGPLVQRSVDAIIEFSRKFWEKTGINLGKYAFYPIHRKLGGRLRLLVSGGSALPPDVMKSFRGLGFPLYEGYGMTESSPVLTVQRPGDDFLVGSVGRALPGVDVKLYQPNERGVGEIIAKGPNVMAGYDGQPEATDAVLRDGWLHTGDLGRLDEDDNLFIVGRKKEMILGTSGENVYPDELEELYRDTPYVKEISVVGLPVANSTGETVAALVVPEYEEHGQGEVSRETVRERVREFIRDTSKQLPLYKRLKTYHLWDLDLPKTSTRKVKRREVVAELDKLERATSKANQARSQESASQAAGESKPARSGEWVRDVIAQVTQKSRTQIQADTRLDELGFDSLMFTELNVALDAAGATIDDPSALLDLATVADLEVYVRKQGLAKAKEDKRRRFLDKQNNRDDNDEIEVPEPLVRAGRSALRAGMRALYQRYLDTDVTGTAYIPPTGGYIVAANHASHLDTGLVKHALGEQGDLLVALAAKDYFFDDPVRRAYFENFTNLVPMERYGSLRESLRLAGEILRSGYILLIFPEGTRSVTGEMIDFKPSLGYLAMHNRCGILPMYLAGTHDRLPKGNYLPKRGQVSAHVAPFTDYRALVTMTEGHKRSAGYRVIATHVERAVRAQTPAEFEWTLGAAGRQPYEEFHRAEESKS